MANTRTYQASIFKSYNCSDFVDLSQKLEIGYYLNKINLEMNS